MTESGDSVNAIATFLSNLRSFPIWVLAGVAMAGYVVLFVAPVSNVNNAAFRNQWGVWVWIVAVTFSILALTRIADEIWQHTRALRARSANRPLRVVERTGNRRWTVTQQPDGSFVSQVSLDVNVANVTDHPVRVVRTWLIRPNPSQDLLNAVAMVHEIDRVPNAFDTVLPHGSAMLNLFFLVHRKLAPQGTIPINTAANIA